MSARSGVDLLPLSGSLSGPPEPVSHQAPQNPPYASLLTSRCSLAFKAFRDLGPKMSAASPSALSVHAPWLWLIPCRPSFSPNTFTPLAFAYAVTSTWSVCPCIPTCRITYWSSQLSLNGTSSSPLPLAKANVSPASPLSWVYGFALYFVTIFLMISQARLESL